MGFEVGELSISWLTLMVDIAFDVRGLEMSYAIDWNEEEVLVDIEWANEAHSLLFL